MVQGYPSKGVFTLQVQFELFADLEEAADTAEGAQPPAPSAPAAQPPSDEKLVEDFMGRVKAETTRAMEAQHGVLVHMDLQCGMLGFCSIARERELEAQQQAAQAEGQRGARDSTGKSLLSKQRQTRR